MKMYGYLDCTLHLVFRTEEGVSIAASASSGDEE
jgi:hypothetical protein